MNIKIALVVNSYSIIILIFICIQTLKNTDIKQLQHRLFFMLLLVNILMLVLDIFSRFDGNQGTIYSVINRFGNFSVYLLNLLIPSLWFLYVHFQVFHEEKKLKQLLYILLAIYAVYIIIFAISQCFGWLYYIDSENIYHRGPLFWLPVFVTVALAVSAFILTVVNRKRIERKYFISLLLFPVFPSACIALQIIFYGMSLMLNAVAFSLLIIFVNIQNRNMDTDFLTGAYNRKRLEIYMNKKISTSTKNKTFSAILIDLDKFKLINDTFGHNVGDYVLEYCVNLLKSCLKPHDFIARFGGDEFCIILDISTMNDLEATVCKIKACIEEHNKHCIESYKFTISMGYAVYDFQSHMSAEKFQKQIDTLMYENKRARRGN